MDLGGDNIDQVPALHRVTQFQTLLVQWRSWYRVSLMKPLLKSLTTVSHFHPAKAHKQPAQAWNAGKVSS